MLNGQLTFLAPVFGHRSIAFEPQMVTPAHSCISRIDVSAPKTTDSRRCKIHITIVFASVASEDEARLIGSQIATNILDRIAFEQNIWIGEPPAPHGHFVNVTSSGTEASVGRAVFGFTAIGVGHALVELDERGLVRLRNKLNARRLKGRTYFPLFRSALGTENPIDRYLALYRILLVIHDDKQQDLDKFLHGEFGDKLTPRPGQKAKPGKPKSKETVFTKLRNEVAHIRKRTRLEITRQQMEQHMEGLIERVKKAIERKG